MFFKMISRGESLGHPQDSLVIKHILEVFDFFLYSESEFGKAKFKKLMESLDVWLR